MTMSATKTVQIGRSAAESFAFIADPTNMPQWAIHNVTSIRPVPNGRWEMETPRGKATLIPRYDSLNRILDHDFIDAGRSVWSVAGRVIAVGPSESVYIITLPKPDNLPVEAFEAGMKLMDDELAALKRCIESLSLSPPKTIQTVCSVYEAFGRRDMPHVFSLLSREIEVQQSMDLPWGGTYRGHDGVREFFGALTSRINSQVTIERYIDAGDHVAAVGWTEGTVTATGAAFRVPIVHLWQVQEGLVVGARFYIDHPPMLKALRQAGQAA